MVVTSPTTLKLPFKGKTTSYTVQGYRKRVTQLARAMEEVGVIIENVRFSSKSSSVYVTFSLNRQAEKKLGFQDKLYLGQFVISDHKRYYDLSTKTFYLQKANDIADLEKQIYKELKQMIRGEIGHQGYLCVLSKKELNALRIVTKMARLGTFFSVSKSAYTSGSALYDVVSTDAKFTHLGLTRDEVTCKLLNTLCFKSCVTTHKTTGTKLKIILASTGEEFIRQYGAELDTQLWLDFVSTRSLNLWENKDDLIEPVDMTATECTVSEEEMTELGVTLEWFQEYIELHDNLMLGIPLSSVEKTRWGELMADKLEEWLPEERVILGHHVFASANRGSFLIQVNRHEPVYYRMMIHPNRSECTDWVSCMFGSDGVETLRSLKVVCESELPENLSRIEVDDEDLRLYIHLKQLERQKVSLAASVGTFKEALTGSPIHVIRCFIKETTLSKPLNCPQTHELVKLIAKFSQYGIWAWSDVAGKTNFKRVHSTETSDALFKSAQQFMPWVVDDIMQQDEPCVPIITHVALGMINYIRPSEIMIY